MGLLFTANMATASCSWLPLRVAAHAQLFRDAERAPPARTTAGGVHGDHGLYRDPARSRRHSQPTPLSKFLFDSADQHLVTESQAESVVSMPARGRGGA
jgi:hypothetical protein